MIPNSTRKQFFAKLLGVAAAASLIPKLHAKPATAKPGMNSSMAGTKRLELRVDPRSVARRAEPV